MLSNEIVAKIKDDIARGVKTQKEIAAEHNCSRSLISDISCGRVYKDISKPDPTNARIHQLEGLLNQRNEEISYYKKKASTAQRAAVDFNATVEVIQGMISKPLKAPDQVIDFNEPKEIEEDVVLLLSDGHWDAMIHKRNNNGLEEFNPNVALARAEYLTSTLVGWCINNLKTHKFNRLWLFGLGDFGNYRIHGAEKHSAHKNAIKSALWAGQLLSLMARDLSQYFPNVLGTFVSGNHGRQKEVNRKDYQEPTNSYDYLAAKTAEIYCHECDRVDFAIPDSFTTFVKIMDWTYHLSHGDDIPSVMGIPWYGIDRKTLRLVRLHQIINRKIDVNVMGHFHESIIRPNSFPRTIVNGCFPATDPFASNKCDGYVEPMQIAFGVHKHRPISWNLPIFLKGGGDKKEGRYKIDIVS